MSDNKTIAKNTIFLYVRMFIVMGVALFTSRVVLEKLGFEDFGLWGVVGGVVSMFTFLNGSLSGATSRFLTFELGKKDFLRLKEIFNVTLVCHIIISLIIVFLSETIGLWFFYHKMVIPEPRFQAAFWVYQISIIMTVISIVQVPYGAIIVARENMKFYAYLSILETVSKLAVVYLLVYAPMDKLVYYALLQLFVQICMYICNRQYCRKHYPESHFQFSTDKAAYKEIFVYASTDLIGNLSIMAQGQGLNILLNLFYGPVVNAARAIAYQVQGAVTQFSNNFMTAVRPQLIKSYAEGDTRRTLSLMYYSSCFSFYLMWLISFPLCLEADYVLGLWLGDFPNHTVSFLILILALCLIQSIKSPRTTVFHATGHIKLINLTVGTLLCAAFPLAYIFLKCGLSPESVFWAAIISLLCAEVASIIILKRYVDYSIPHYLKHVYLRCAVVAAVSFVIPYLTYDLMRPSFLRLICTCIITSISILATVYFIGLNTATRRMTVDFIRMQLKKRK